MKKTLRGTVGAVVASVGLLASVALPASATTSKVDAIMANDLHVKTLPATPLVTGGSSFDANLIQAGISQYNVDNPKGTVLSAYSSTSSGTGRSTLLTGHANIGFSDFPLNQGGDCDLSGSPVAGATTPCTTYTATGTLSQYVQIPVALGGVAIIYNLGTESTALANGIAKYGLILNGQTLGQIFAGKVTTWNAAAIKATNPHLKSLLPATTIVPVSRKDGSGTTFGFKDYLSRVDATDFPTTAGTTATAGCSTPVAYPNSAHFCAATLDTAGNSAALDGQLSTTTGAIGYVEYGYALLNGNPTATLVNASGKAVKISEAGILADATAGLKKIGKHFSTSSLADFSIQNELGVTNYPIALFSFAIVPLALPGTDAPTAIATVKFLDFMTHQGGGTSPSTTFGQDLANNNGYVPIPTAMQTTDRKLISNITFGGTKVLGSTN
jgi:ABC-type phosphate transport system substrate-binding protein